MGNEELILNALLDLKKDVGSIQASMIEIKDAHAQRLDELETENKRQWWAHIAVIPIIGVLHKLAEALKWIK